MKKNERELPSAICLMHHFAHNFGDQAILKSTIQKIDGIHPDVHKIAVFYDGVLPENANDLYGTNNIKLIFIKNSFFLNRKKLLLCLLAPRKLLKLIVSRKNKLLKNIKYTIYLGGHHFTDINGTTSLLKSLVSLKIAIALGKPVILFPMTIGPISKEILMQLLNHFLKKVQRILIRDSSCIVLNNKIVSEKCENLPDVVYGLQVEEFLDNEKVPSSSKRIGITLYNKNTVGFEDENRRYIVEISKFIRYLENLGYQISIINMESPKVSGEKEIIDTLKQKLPISTKVTYTHNENYYDAVRQIKKMDYMICTKTHSSIFSFILNKPSIGIAYHKKMIDFYTGLELRDYVFDFKDISKEHLINRFTKLIKNENIVKERLAKEIKTISENIKLTLQGELHAF